MEEIGDYVFFEKEICDYCNMNVGRGILFTAFMNVWPERLPVKRKDLAVYTSRIVSNLIVNEVLKEVDKNDCQENVYGYYEVLKQVNSVNVEELKNKKMRKSGISYKILDME